MKNETPGGLHKKEEKLSFQAPKNIHLQNQFKYALIEHIAENHYSFSQFRSDPFENIFLVANKTTLERMASSKSKSAISQVCDIIAGANIIKSHISISTNIFV